MVLMSDVAVIVVVLDAIERDQRGKSGGDFFPSFSK
jgi:hypothetical protein